MASKTDSNIRAKVWFEPEQVEDIRNACYDDSVIDFLQQRNDAIITLLYDTGLRVGELVDLDVEMLCDDKQTLFLPSHIQKDYPTDDSPPPVTMDLSADTTRTLQSYLSTRWRDSEALFPSRKSDRISTQGVRYLLHDMSEIAAVEPWNVDGSRGDYEDVTPHTLRHSLAFRMLHEEEGTTLYDVRNRLRHRTIQTTERVCDHFRRV